jgi:hypothetical protein
LNFPLPIAAPAAGEGRARLVQIESELEGRLHARWALTEPRKGIGNPTAFYTGGLGIAGWGMGNSAVRPSRQTPDSRARQTVWCDLPDTSDRAAARYGAKKKKGR